MKRHENNNQAHQHHNHHHQHRRTAIVQALPSTNSNYYSNTYHRAPAPVGGVAINATAHMIEAQNFIHQGNVAGLRELFNRTNVSTTFTGSLWYDALNMNTGHNPNHEIISLMALYGVPFGNHEDAVLRAFRQGQWSNPKETLMRMCRDANNNDTVRAQLNSGLLEGSVLLKVLRSEPNGHFSSMTLNNKWETEARQVLDFAHQRASKNTTTNTNRN